MRRKNLGVGFELEAAMQRLEVFVMNTGVVPLIDTEPGRAQELAAHHLHGAGDDSCNLKPCRLGGVCHALAEIARFEAERRTLRSALETIEAANEAQKWLATSGERFAEALRALASYGHNQHLGPRFHDHVALCDQPLAVLVRLDELAASIAGLDERLRDLFWRPEHRRRRNEKGADWLLTAVWQHLDWGGFTYQEVFEFVPDRDPKRVRVTNPAARRALVDRVRKRIQSGEARTILPRELLASPSPKDKAEKSMRRRSSR